MVIIITALLVLNQNHIDENNDDVMILTRIVSTHHVGGYSLTLRENGMLEVSVAFVNHYPETTQLTNSQMGRIRRIMRRFSDREYNFWTSNCIWRIHMYIEDERYIFTAGISDDPARDHLFRQLVMYSPVPIVSSRGIPFLEFTYGGERPLRYVLYEYTYIRPVIPVGSAFLVSLITALLVIRIRKRRMESDNQEQAQ